MRRQSEVQAPVRAFSLAVLRVATLVLLGATCGLPAWAEEMPSREMPRIEFDEAIQRALAQNRTVALAATAISRAEVLLQQARTVNRPSLGVTASELRRNEGISFSGVVTQPQSQTIVSATASVSVLAAASWAAVAQGRDQVEISKRAFAEVEQRVAVSTAETYLAVIAAQRQLEVEQRALDNARAHLDYARTRLEVGAGSRLDEVRAAQLVSSEEALLENSILALLASREALGVLMAEDGPVDAGAAPSFEGPEAVDPATWMEARPDVQLQAAAIEAADRALRDSWKDRVPVGSLAFVPQYITPAGAFQPSNTWQLILSFTQPIFDGGRRQTAEALREIALDQAKIGLSNVEIAARSELRVARERLESSERALTSARQAADQARDAADITTEAFRLGSTTSLELIDAERIRRDAETNAARSEDSVRLAKLGLMVALGQFPQ